MNLFFVTIMLCELNGKLEYAIPFAFFIHVHFNIVASYDN